MKKHQLLLLFITLVFYSCQKPAELDLNTANIIPKPLQITANNSSLKMDNKTQICVLNQTSELMELGIHLSGLIKKQTGLELAVIPEHSAKKWGKQYIYLSISDKEDNTPNDGYLLNINEKSVMLQANTRSGMLNCFQTLLQVLPVIDLSDKIPPTSVLLPTGVIYDYPEYAYRGVMLDVARHFFDVSTVKRFIDYLAAYKINTLHMHLADDQGWRIEIKSWPNLTEIGGQTQVDGGSGGFYTQEQYTELIQYAAFRGITIIPEIDMPGHTNAALASYAELNCDGKARSLYTGTNVGFSTLCVDKEVTYQFVDDVIRELSEITPGEYIHIGGDESHVTPMADYIKFMNRVQIIVQKYGKKVIGWDEIAHSELLENTVVQFWSKASNAIQGVEKGAKVLMSPSKKAYLDMKYDSTTKLGLDWAALIEIDDAYNWDPTTYVEGITRSSILGIESPLWSETVTNLDEIEFLVFPRLLAHAEIGWTKKEKRGWVDFRYRLSKHANRMKNMGIDFYPSPLIPWDYND